ncbi:DUF2835 family protein [Gallaecimonas mangrovi]|uniref:DUF2835 family protein n=1 Tax=Gallaecimonas mangrovi TaxID=2291597 RepID=UPI000E2018F0|nr:DUF2835 family protein [Gallaecimonas mangrovi]
MRQFALTIDFDYGQLQAAYERPDTRLLLRAEGGQLLSIPFRHLRPYVSNMGIHGRFAVELDERNHILRFYALP